MLCAILNYRHISGVVFLIPLPDDSLCFRMIGAVSEVELDDVIEHLDVLRKSFGDAVIGEFMFIGREAESPREFSVSGLIGDTVGEVRDYMFLLKPHPYSRKPLKFRDQAVGLGSQRDFELADTCVETAVKFYPVADNRLVLVLKSRSYSKCGIRRARHDAEDIAAHKLFDLGENVAHTLFGSGVGDRLREHAVDECRSAHSCPVCGSVHCRHHLVR